MKTGIACESGPHGSGALEYRVDLLLGRFVVGRGDRGDPRPAIDTATNCDAGDDQFTVFMNVEWERSKPYCSGAGQVEVVEALNATKRLRHNGGS